MENPSEKLQTATLAGGCFWCTEAIFKRIKGVKKVTSGYTGGNMADPSYERVSSGSTGHAEAVQVEFDSTIISFDQLLEIFWATHDPTTLNRQGGDSGTQYRSTIFYENEEQKTKAEKSMSAMEASGQLNSKIVTAIEPLEKFYAAESYHQDYYEQNKDSNPYCSIVIDPKIKKLLEKFNGMVKEDYLNK